MKKMMIKLCLASLIFQVSLVLYANEKQDPNAVRQQPPVVKKPVKVYILLGQSNMFGFGKVSGVETRGRFIIDPDGIIQGFEVLTPSVGRNVSESIRQINAFQLVRNSKGTEATPSGWKPGKLTLKPGVDLVGKVWEVWKTDMAFD